MLIRQLMNPVAPSSIQISLADTVSARFFFFFNYMQKEHASITFIREGIQPLFIYDFICATYYSCALNVSIKAGKNKTKKKKRSLSSLLSGIYQHIEMIGSDEKY